MQNIHRWVYLRGTGRIAYDKDRNFSGAVHPSFTNILLSYEVEEVDSLWQPCTMHLFCTIRKILYFRILGMKIRRKYVLEDWIEFSEM